MRTPATRSIVVSFLTWLTLITPAARGLDLQKQIDPLAQKLLDDDVAVGFVIGIFKDGQTQAIGYGETTKGSHSGPDRDTVYEIGSISKVFTGVLLADFVDRGLVKLDDPLQQYLPQDVKLPVAEGQPITLEHLATHTSGLPRLPDNLKPADLQNPYADYTADRMYAFLRGHQLRRAPGKFEYSNYGMGLLGQVLSRRADSTYEQLLIDRITRPLGMHDTRITLDDKLRGRLAPPYNAALKPEKNWDLPALAGAGGIRSTVRDMLKFIVANLADDGEPLTPALRLAQQKRRSIGHGSAIGLGWHIAPDGVSCWHNGMTGGYHAWLAIVPDKGVGTVVLANTASPHISEFGQQLTQLALGNDVTPPPDRAGQNQQKNGP